MRPQQSITGPLVLILLGTLFLVHTLSPAIPIFELIAQYWPWLLIGWGVVGLVEASLRFLQNGPVPVRPVSGGGWVLAVAICFVGFSAFQVHRAREAIHFGGPNNWWQQFGLDQGMDAFGDEHDYSVNPLQRSVGSAPHIVIENFRGDAKITGSDGGEMTVSGHKTIRAINIGESNAADAATPVEIVTKGSTVIIRCNQDRSHSRARVSTNLEMRVPRGASIEATGSTGDFDVSSLTGDVDISSENAGLRLQNIAGRVKLDTRKSDVIRCTDIGGTVDVRGHGADVELTKIGGQVTVSGSYSGSVALHDLAKPVKVENLRTEFDVQQVPGEIRLERGSVSMRNVVGPTRLSTRTTDVTMEGFSNGLDLMADKGDIELRPGHVPLGKITVHTRAGNIEMDLPQDAGFAMQANTERGDISNEFGGGLQEHSEGHGARLEGSVGSGPEVSLVTNRGSITLRKTSGSEGLTKVALSNAEKRSSDLERVH